MNRSFTPGEWPILAAALTEARLIRAGLTTETRFLDLARAILRDQSSDLRVVENQLSELMAELTQELK
jgi:hypothetical protein